MAANSLFFGVRPKSTAHPVRSVDSLLASKSAKLYGWIEPSGERGGRAEPELGREREGEREREQPAAAALQFSSPPLSARDGASFQIQIRSSPPRAQFLGDELLKHVLFGQIAFSNKLECETGRPSFPLQTAISSPHPIGAVALSNLEFLVAENTKGKCRG